MRTFVSILTVITLIASCSSKNTEPVKEEEHHEEAGNMVSLTEVQIKTAGIELGNISGLPVFFSSLSFFVVSFSE